ncbi:MAG: hypothetical protein ACYC5K_04700, partial [Saccharofermentanales bacterium]
SLNRQAVQFTPEACDMDKIRVLFLDNDVQYCSTLAALLTRNTADFSFHGISSYYDGSISPPTVLMSQASDRLDISTLEVAFSSTIIFYNPSEYCSPPPESHVVILAYQSENPSQEPAVRSIYRYSPACDFILLLEEYIEQNPQLADELIHRNLCCITGQACGKARKSAILELAATKVQDGLIPVLVEICPRHDCLFHPDTYGNGNTLSDAMLRLMAGDLNHEELGTYMVPAGFHMLQFRAFECTDDIFECSPDNIRRLVEVLRKWDEHTAHSHFIIISCHSIPFSFIYKACVVCDSLILLNMADSDFNASEYNRELSSLLANLPGSCSISRKSCFCSKEGGDADDDPVRE